ncbi:MAG TPA: hypothetical protein VNX68_18775 [Nitrosopumilaceae archaeon]|nr:hypothetical protein [Nitrosopumilaceae archaeon]
MNTQYKPQRNISTDRTVNMHVPERTDMAAKVTRQTWRERYNAIISDTGYDTGRKIIKALSVNDWHNKYKKNPAAWFIDAGFLHYSLVDSGLFVDFSRLHADFIRPPINYFTLYSPRNENIFRLFTLLQQEGYYLVNKEIPSNINPDSLKGLPMDEIIRTIERRATLNSIMPEMIVRIMNLAWDDEPVETNHVLIFSQNYQLMPAMQQLRRMGITTSLAISPNRTNGNYFLNQFDNLVPMLDLFEACKALYRRNERPTYSSNQESNQEPVEDMEE